MACICRRIASTPFFVKVLVCISEKSSRSRTVESSHSTYPLYPQIAAARPLLGHASKQADILTALLAIDDPLPQTERVLTRADASPATLSPLARKGWIAIEPKRSLILPTPGVAVADLDRAPQQQAVLSYLQQQEGPVEEKVVDALLKLRDDLSGRGDLGESRDRLLSESHHLVVDLVNQFFQERLYLMPEIVAYIDSIGD